MNKDASMELFPKLDMIGDYYTKALQGSQLCQCRNIILGIHEDDIQAYNASRRDFLGEKKLNWRKKKKNTRRMPNSQATRATKECVV